MKMLANTEKADSYKRTQTAGMQHVALHLNKKD